MPWTTAEAGEAAAAAEGRATGVLGPAAAATAVREGLVEKELVPTATGGVGLWLTAANRNETL